MNGTPQHLTHTYHHLAKMVIRTYAMRPNDKAIGLVERYRAEFRDLDPTMVDEFIEVAARHGRKIRACISITQHPN